MASTPQPNRNGTFNGERVGDWSWNSQYNRWFDTAGISSMLGNLGNITTPNIFGLGNIDTQAMNESIQRNIQESEFGQRMRAVGEGIQRTDGMYIGDGGTQGGRLQFSNQSNNGDTLNRTRTPFTQQLDSLAGTLTVNVRIKKSIPSRGGVLVNGVQDNFLTRSYSYREFLGSGVRYEIEESGKKSNEYYKLFAIEKFDYSNTSTELEEVFFAGQYRDSGITNGALNRRIGVPRRYWCIEKKYYKNNRFVSTETYDSNNSNIPLYFDLSDWNIVVDPIEDIPDEEYQDEFDTITETTTTAATGQTVFLNKPTIYCGSSSVTHVLGSSGTSISWNSTNAQYVNLSIGNTIKRVSTSGNYVLSDGELQRVGQKTVYLQAVGDGGSSDPKKIVVNVIDRQSIKGPDITHITFPQNILGADFQGFNVDFKVNWSSINTNWVDVYVGKESDKTQLASRRNPQGSLTLNVQKVLQKAGQNISEDTLTSQFKLIFIPYNSEGDKLAKGKAEEVIIDFDKSNIKLRRRDVIRDVRRSISSMFSKDILDRESSKYLTHLLHFGNADNKIISTWGIDKETFSEYEVVDKETGREEKVKEVKTLVLKLYEPLPKSVQPNQQVWLSKVQSVPIIEQFTVVDEGVEKCIVLQPNLNEKFHDNVGLQIFDDLIASGSETSTDLVSKFVSGSGFNLEELDIHFLSSSTEELNGVIVPTGNHDYYWSNFVKYSSATERVENFYYKMKNLEFQNHRLRIVSSSIAATTGSVSSVNEKKKIETQISNLLNGFDSFENWLYASSSEDTFTYPKENETGSFLNPTGSDALSWYEGALFSAENYDKQNSHRLVNNLPLHVKDSNEGQEFVLFFDMIGQHFDTLYLYTKGISDSKKLEHKYDTGIKDSLIYQMLESLGWDADIGVKSQALWAYAFGKDSDGTEVTLESGKARQNEVWRRILNNLPYLMKHKGTKRAVYALMACYGIPASLLTIMEYGGPKDVTTSGTQQFTYDDRTTSISISGSSAITVDWKEYNGEYPNSVEIRLNTETKQDQQIISGSEWSLDILKDTGSHAQLQLTVGDVSASTDAFPFFNDEYTQIVVNRTAGSSYDSFEVYAKEGFNERIRNEGSLTLNAYNKGWTSGSLMTIGGNTLDATIDEFRLWTLPLAEANIDNHTLHPMAIDGTSPSASSEDLIFRNDFEYPKDRSSSGDTDIKNVAIINNYSTASMASGFENSSSYPYQYVPYDRVVTAQVPQSGFNVNNKFRFEDQFNLDGTPINDSDIDLSYRQRATQKSFDKSAIDSDKLGLFFSPIKEINMDILKSVGPLNIDDYIGDPSDRYNYEYSSLKTFREYYFDRFNLNFNEYVQLVRYIDSSLFTQLESLVPARAKVASGLLFEPHILERSKVQWNKPQGSNNQYQGVIDDEVVNVNSEDLGIDVVIDTDEETVLNGDLPFYTGVYTSSEDTNVIGEISDFEGQYQLQDETEQSGEITRNEEATMGGFEFNIDAKLTGSVSSQYFQSVGYQSVPEFGLDDISVAGFGLYGEDGNSIRTRLDGNGNIVKDRIKAFLVKERFTEIVPEYPTVGALDYEDTEVTKFRFKVNILPFTGSDSNESSLAFTGSSDYVSHKELDGYFSSHYRNVGDLTSGLENSFFNGSKQTSATTLDGGSPVQIFTTNPNTLRVSDSGRGSGEPILEVD